MTENDAAELAEHLASPDPPEMPPRGHRVTQAGDPRRFELLAIQPNVYTALVRQEHEEGYGRRPRLS